MTHAEIQGAFAPNPASSAPSSVRLPLLASTHFCLDVLLQGSLLDLESVVEIIGFDPCACSRVFAAAAPLNTSPDERWCLQECVVALGRAGLVRTLAYEASTWDEQARLHAFATDAVSIGRAAHALAPALSLPAQEAYIVGLLHAMDRVSGILTGCHPSPAGTAHLPPCSGWLNEALAALRPSSFPSLWYHLVLAAHQVDLDADARLNRPDLQEVCRCGLPALCESKSP